MWSPARISLDPRGHWTKTQNCSSCIKSCSVIGGVNPFLVSHLAVFPFLCESAFLSVLSSFKKIVHLVPGTLLPSHFILLRYSWVLLNVPLFYLSTYLTFWYKCLPQSYVSSCDSPHNGIYYSICSLLILLNWLIFKNTKTVSILFIFSLAQCPDHSRCSMNSFWITRKLL